MGAARYAEDPSTEVLIACYSFDGGPMRTWVPGTLPPEDLLAHVRAGGTVQAWNSFFEWLIWTHVCVPKYGWPPLLLRNTRDTMAAAKAYGLPGKLLNAAKALGGPEQKDTAGKSLIQRFCVPRTPTKNNLAFRNYMGHDHARAFEFYRYCAQDVRAEDGIAMQIPALSAEESEVWHLDQEINARGVAVDMARWRNAGWL